MRELFVTPQFKKDFQRPPSEIQSSADTIVQQLRSNPVDATANIIKLKSIVPPAWRVRIGVYRLIYTFGTQSITTFENSS